MKGFKDSTRTQSGHNFPRIATPVKPHVRNMPVKKMATSPPFKGKGC